MRKNSAFLLVVLFFVGCETKIPTYEDVKVQISIDKEKDRKLAKRFVEYWHARITGDMKKSFEYELPYQRYVDGYKGYTSKVSPLNNNTRMVLQKIDYEHPNVAVLERRVFLNDRNWTKYDKWIFVEGKWYHKYYQNILPPMDDEEARFQ